MEKFLLNLVNMYSLIAYNRCSECRCGYFEFNGYRAIPTSVSERLGFTEHYDFDDELDRWIFTYSPNFNA